MAERHSHYVSRIDLFITTQVRKRTGNGMWKPVHLILTKEQLLICRELDRPQTHNAQAHQRHKASAANVLSHMLGRRGSVSSHISESGSHTVVGDPWSDAIVIDWLSLEDVSSCDSGHNTVNTLEQSASIRLTALADSKRRSSAISIAANDSNKEEVARDADADQEDDVFVVVSRPLCSAASRTRGHLLTWPTGKNQKGKTDQSQVPTRKFTFQAESAAACRQWRDSIRKASGAKQKLVAAEKHRVMTPWQRCLDTSRQIHESNAYRFFFSGLIILSFASAIAEAQMRPRDGSRLMHVFDVFEDIFTCLFAVEVVISWGAEWFWPYFRSGWNVFNLAIILTSIWSVYEEDAPAFHALRAVRVFRATKLLSYFGALREIVAATLASIVPVLSSFLILGLVTCVYATMGVTFFGDDCEYFADFSEAIFTMLQVLTGDGWASEVARPMWNLSGSTVFFVSYVLVGWCVLLNIVVAVRIPPPARILQCSCRHPVQTVPLTHDALCLSIQVLLDELFQKMAAKRAKNAKAAALAQLSAHSFDPLMEVLAASESIEELRSCISSVFVSLDVDMSGSVGLEEMQQGLPKLLGDKFQSHGASSGLLLLNEEDWLECTAGFRGADGGVPQSQWDQLMLKHLKMYLMRNISSAEVIVGASLYRILHQCIATHANKLAHPHAFMCFACSSGQQTRTAPCYCR